jgi:hypothetical protein
VRPADIVRYEGLAKARTVAGGVGVVGLLISLFFMFVGTEEARTRFAHSYLMGFAYWVAIAVASLIFVAIFHTAKVKWITVVRRPLEAVASSVLVLAVLSLPLYLPGTLHKLYLWTHDAHHLFEQGLISEEQVHHLHHKQHGYLNLPFFYVRQLVYFGVWILVSTLFLKWSRAQDAVGGYEQLARLRRVGPGVLPLLALTITFAAFDWLMSLTPLWQSTIYGVYYFAGGILTAVAVWIILTVNSTEPGGPGSVATAEHLHNQGKYLLAFTAFWAYIAFSQFLLMWIANLPEETPFWVSRMGPQWRAYSVAVVVCHFVIPFFALLSRDLKRKPRAIGFVAAYILVVQFMDMMWMVLPNNYPTQFAITPGALLVDLAAWLGVGGITMAYAIHQLRSGFAVPVKDPYLPESLRYVQP